MTDSPKIIELHYPDNPWMLPHPGDSIRITIAKIIGHDYIANILPTVHWDYYTARIADFTATDGSVAVLLYNHKIGIAYGSFTVQLRPDDANFQVFQARQTSDTERSKMFYLTRDGHIVDPNAPKGIKPHTYDYNIESSFQEFLAHSHTYMNRWAHNQSEFRNYPQWTASQQPPATS